MYFLCIFFLHFKEKNSQAVLALKDKELIWNKFSWIVHNDEHF